MRRLLLLSLLVMAGCRTADPPSEPWSLYTKTGPAPLEVSQGPPPAYRLTDNVDSNTSLRSRQ